MDLSKKLKKIKNREQQNDNKLTISEPPKNRKSMKTKTKQTSRMGTESKKWTSHGGFSVGGEGEECGGKVQGKRSIIGRHKIDEERSKMV